MMTTPEKIKRRQRRESWFIAGLCLALVASFLYSRYRAEQDAKAQQVIACENANESRDATRRLWNYLFTLTPTSNPRETQQRGELLGWINLLYAERDCSDLSRRYEIPPPPKLRD